MMSQTRCDLREIADELEMESGGDDVAAETAPAKETLGKTRQYNRVRRFVMTEVSATACTGTKHPVGAVPCVT